MNNWINWYKIHAEDKNSKVFSGVSPLTFTGDGNPLQTISITAGEGGVGIPTHNLLDPAKIEFFENNPWGSNSQDKNLKYILYNDFIPAQAMQSLERFYAVSLAGEVIKSSKPRTLWWAVSSRGYNSSFELVENSEWGAYDWEQSSAPFHPITYFNEKMTVPYKKINDIAYYQILIGYDAAIDTGTLKIQLYQRQLDDSNTYDYEPYGYKALLLHSSGSKLIFMDSPIAEGETRVFSNLEIPTVKGENTFIISGNAGPATISVQTQGMSEGFENYFRTQLCLRH